MKPINYKTLIALHILPAASMLLLLCAQLWVEDFRMTVWGYYLLVAAGLLLCLSQYQRNKQQTDLRPIISNGELLTLASDYLFALVLVHIFTYALNAWAFVIMLASVIPQLMRLFYRQEDDTPTTYTKQSTNTSVSTSIKLQLFIFYILWIYLNTPW